MLVDFRSFSKISRLKRDIMVTEKIDGTNAQILITTIPKDYVDEKMIGWWYGPDATTWAMYAGSRTRWITPGDDNYGFAKWAKENLEELKKLGPGQHFGEWWGQGIQRKYGMPKRVFSLFNASLWNNENLPACCSVVPVLYIGPFDSWAIEAAINTLTVMGSKAAPGFMKPEGIVVFHSASGHLYKQTIEKDNQPKGVLDEDRSVGHA